MDREKNWIAGERICDEREKGGPLKKKGRYMHSNPAATRSLCCRSRVEWLLPLHSASLQTSIFSPLFPFCTWLHSRYIARAKYGALPGNNERIAFHYVEERSVRASQRQVKIASSTATDSCTRTRCTSTWRTQEVFLSEPSTI